MIKECRLLASAAPTAEPEHTPAARHVTDALHGPRPDHVVHRLGICASRHVAAAAPRLRAAPRHRPRGHGAAPRSGVSHHAYGVHLLIHQDRVRLPRLWRWWVGSRAGHGRVRRLQGLPQEGRKHRLR